MAYTGSGTEQDPYLVSTLGDFVECAGKSSAYVKVISDIDGSGVTFVRDTFVSVYAKKIYADTRKVIKNFILQGTGLFSFTSGAEIHNLELSNILIKATNIPFALRPMYSQYFSLYDCVFSIRAETHGYRVANFISYCHFYRCALKIEFINETIPAQSADVMLLSSAEDCVLEFVNLPEYRSSSNDNALFTSVSLNYCVLKMSVALASGHNASMNLTSRTTNSNNIFCISASEAFGITLSGSYLISDSENSENVTFTCSAQTYWQLTKAQIMSESYLRSINFIP